MGKVYPHGKVLAGKYVDKEVYVWIHNESLMIHDGLVYNGLIMSSPESKRVFLINSSSIVAYEQVGATTLQANTEGVGTATFLFGIGAGILASQLGQQEVHNIAVQYADGEKSLLQLNSYAYQTFMAFSFGLPSKLTGSQNQRGANQGSSDRITVTGENYASVMTRIDLFIEDGEWDKANQYCESALDYDATNGNLYYKKLFIDYQAKDKKELAKHFEDAKKSDTYKKALRFGNEETIAQFEEISELEKEYKYQTALQAMRAAKDDTELIKASQIFARIIDYKDAREQKADCEKRAVDYRQKRAAEDKAKRERIEAEKKDKIYNEAKKYIEQNTSNSLEYAIMNLKQIPGWKDADELILKLEENKGSLKKNEKKKRNIILIIVAAAICVAIALFFIIGGATAKQRTHIIQRIITSEWYETENSALRLSTGLPAIVYTCKIEFDESGKGVLEYSNKHSGDSYAAKKQFQFQYKISTSPFGDKIHITIMGNSENFEKFKEIIRSDESANKQRKGLKDQAFLTISVKLKKNKFIDLYYVGDGYESHAKY